MNSFKRKALLCTLVALTVAAVTLTGCASDQAYLKAQADAAIADGNARVAEASARAEEARAVIALAPRIDAGGAAGYLMVKELKSALGSGGAHPVAAVQRPRDFLDYFQAFTQAAAVLGNIAVPLVTVKEAGKTSRAGFDRDIHVEQARQVGETSRIGSVAQIARDVAANQPTPSITNNIGGNGVIGSGTYTAPTTTTNTTTTRTCNGGSGAAGGTSDTGGQAGAGGSGQGGTC
jgi:hypothetical protein